MKKLNLILIVFLFTAGWLLNSCKKKDTPTAPQVVTPAVPSVAMGTLTGNWTLSDSIGNTSNLAVNGNAIFATSGNSIFKSIDDGNSWSSLNTSFPANYRCFLVNNGNLFVGSGTSVYKSFDNGNSWSQVNIPMDGNTQMVFSLAAIDSNIFAGINNGVMISKDKGSNWLHTGSGLPFMYQVEALVAKDSVLFAGIPGGGPTPNGLYTSTNKGASWTISNNGLPVGTAVTALGANTNNIFASTEKGIYKSGDNGNNWSNVNSLPQYYYGSIYLNGSNIFVTIGGLYLSTNNGNSWSRIDGLPSNRAINIVVVKNDILFVGVGNVVPPAPNDIEGIPYIHGGGVWKCPISSLH